MAEEHATASDIAYRSLLGDLTEGAWPVDARLKSNELATRYGQATGAMREALIRLAAEGFVRNFPQRGFRTIASTPETVAEHAALRVAIEIEATRLALVRGDLAWEANLTAAHHRLAHLETRLRARRERGSDELRMWTDADQAFHRALISACGNEVLIEAQAQAFLRFRLHLASVASDFGFRGVDLVREHEAILEAALDRDAEACASAIRDHFGHYPRALLAAETAVSQQAG